jgi:flagellar hook-length control protein FliK
MAEFAIDLSAVIAPPPVAPPSAPSSARSSARFEDHLGQAGRTPRESAVESSRSPERATDSESATARAPAGSKPAASDQEQEDDSPQDSPNDVEQTGEDAATQPAAANDATGAAAAAGQAGGKAPPEAIDKRRADELRDAAIGKAGGKGVKVAEQHPPGKPGKRASVAANEPATRIDAQSESVELNDAVKETSGDETLTVDKALAGDEKLPPEAAAESSGTAKASAGAENIAAVNVASQDVAEQPATAQKSHTAEAIEAQTVEPTEAAEAPNSAKRTRGKNDEPAARSGLPTSPAREAAAANGDLAAAVDAVAEVASDNGESSGRKEAPSEESKPADRSDTNEPRLGAAPALLAARNDRSHEANGRADGLTEAERARFVQRVASAFRSFGDEGGEVRLRLSPPELGSLRVELTVRDGVLNARLEAETSSARNLLLDNLPALRERLAEQNIKVEKFDVDVRDERRQSPGEQSSGQPEHGHQGQRQRPREFDHRPATAAAVARATRAPIKHGDAGELNIVI